MASILTTAGQQKLSSATPLDQLNITEIAVGDGNGGFPTLLPSMTALTNEVWRGGCSAPIRNPSAPNTLIFEGFIPASSGGYFIREMAIFDDEGDMIAIGHTSLLEKPDDAGGSGLSLTIRLHVALDSASQVDLIYQDGGVIDHAGLTNRDALEAHPAGSISTPALPDLSLPIADVETVLQALKSAAIHPLIQNQLDETLNAVLTRGAWGLGKYLSVADADDAVKSGFYSLPVSLGAGNAPISGKSGALLVIEGGAASGYITQVWIQSNDEAERVVAFRCGNGDPLTWDAEWTFLMNKEFASTAQAEEGDDVELPMNPARVHEAFNKYGLGLNTTEITPISDANSPTETGTYVLTASAANAPSTLASLVLEHKESSSNNASQVCYRSSSTDPQTWRRSRSGATWGAWKEIGAAGFTGNTLETIWTGSSGSVFLNSLPGGYPGDGFYLIDTGALSLSYFIDGILCESVGSVLPSPKIKEITKTTNNQVVSKLTGTSDESVAMYAIYKVV